MSELPSKELVSMAELLRHADKGIDERFRRFFERGECMTENLAAQRMFHDNDSDNAGKKWGLLKSFLWCPARDLWDEGLRFLIGLLEKRSSSAHYVSSFLRIIESGIWYDRSADYMREHIVSKWEGSSAKKSWEQRRGKKTAEKKLKKTVTPRPSSHGNKNRGHRKQKRDLEGKYTRPRGEIWGPWGD